MSYRSLSGAGLKRTRSPTESACANMIDGLESHELLLTENEVSKLIQNPILSDHLKSITLKAKENHARNVSILIDFKARVLQNAEDMLEALYKINDNELKEIQNRIEDCNNLEMQRVDTNSDKLTLEKSIGAQISRLSSLLGGPHTVVHSRAFVTDDDATS